MVKITPLMARQGALLLLSATASLSSGSALAAAALASCAAGTVCYYVAIQPIDVCSSTGTGCAPFNTSSKTGNPGAATSTTPIGFVDPTSGKDITRTIWNQLGVDIAWAPIRQYKNTTFQTLHVTTNAATGTGLTSADFLTLSQQSTISTGILPNPTTPAGVPIGPKPTVVNMFFVNTLVPPTPGTLYGFSWPANNGIAISANTFFPPFPLTPRFDTLAHELGHNLGIDHTDIFNYGGTATPAPPRDLMTTGSNRTEPSSTSNALTQIDGGIGAGTADQLNTDQTTLPSPVTNPNSQQDEVSLSGLLNPLASSTTFVSPPGGGAVPNALVVSNTGNTTTISNAPLAATKPDTTMFFEVSGPTAGIPGETLIGLVITLDQGLRFDPTNRVSFFPNLYVTSFSYDQGNTGDPNCPTPATQCLLINLTNPGLPESSFLDFTQGIVKAPGEVNGGKKPATPNDITTAGAQITYKFSDGLIITSTLTGSFFLTADSQMPDPMVPTQIDPTLFVGTGNLPCTPLPTTPPTCPDPNTTGVSDGDPSQEGGQPGGG